MKLVALEKKNNYDYKQLNENIFKIYLRENFEEKSNCYYYDEYILITEITSLDVAATIEEKWDTYIEAAKLQDEEVCKRNEINTCKTNLSNSDYQVLKCAESFMVGSVLPYDFSLVLAERSALRDKISELGGEISEDDILTAQKARKITEMCAMCQTTITNGIDYNEEHYRLNTTDQINLTSLYSLAQLGQSVPYHADGQVCRVYTPEEMTGLAQAGTQWIIYHTTYFNLLKHQILEMTTEEEINGVYYGIELKEEYQTVLNAIIA